METKEFLVNPDCGASDEVEQGAYGRLFPPTHPPFLPPGSFEGGGREKMALCTELAWEKR